MALKMLIFRWQDLSLNSCIGLRYHASVDIESAGVTVIALNAEFKMEKIMTAKKCFLQASKTVALLASIFALSGNASATLINFDNVANGTVINSIYSALGVTFVNPLGISADNPDSPNIYARTSSTNASPANVVSVFGTGVPAFDSRWGAVEAVFSQGQRNVSIDAAILRLPEGLGTPLNSPRLEIYGPANNLITTIGWDFSVIPQPGAGGITAFETLSFTSSSDNIGKVRFFSSQPGGSPSNFGIFDNLAFSRDGVGGTVPEPGTLVLVTLGILSLGGSRLWRRGLR